MSTHSLDIVPSRPNNFINSDRSNRYVDVYVGNFNGGGAKFGMGKTWGKLIYSISGWGNYPPRQYRRFDNKNIGGRLGLNMLLPHDVYFSIISEFSASTLYKNSYDGPIFPLFSTSESSTSILTQTDSDWEWDVDNEWRDLRIESSLTPLITDIGSFSGKYCFHHWTYHRASSDIDKSANLNEFSLFHEIGAFNGRFETTINGVFEPLDQESKNLSLFNGKVNFGWWEPSDSPLKIGFGFNVFNGNSKGSDNVYGFQPNIKAIWSARFGGVAFLKWNPSVHGHSLRSIMERMPQVFYDSPRGSIVVEKARVELGYELSFFEVLDLKFSGIFHNSENYPLLEYDESSSNSWNIEYGQLESMLFKIRAEYEIYSLGDIELMTSFENAKLVNPGFSESEVKFHPFIVGINGNGYWQNWQFSNAISWHDVTNAVYYPAAKVGSHFEWDIEVGYNLKKGRRISVVCLNLLDNDLVHSNGLEVAPFALMLKGSFGTNYDSFDGLQFK